MVRETEVGQGDNGEEHTVTYKYELRNKLHWDLLLSPLLEIFKFCKQNNKQKTFLEVYSDFFVTRKLHGWLFCLEMGS